MSNVKKNTSLIMERRFVPKGTLIMEQGEAGNCAYLIQSGQAFVFVDKDGQEVELARLEQGQIVGEAALIFDSPRTASVRALSDMNLIVITRKVMDQKLKVSDPTIRALVEMLIKRLVSVNNTIVGNQKGTQDLIDTVNMIYDNLYAALPSAEQKPFKEKVLPKLKDFLDSVQEFQK